MKKFLMLMFLVFFMGIFAVGTVNADGSGSGSGDGGGNTDIEAVKTDVKMLDLICNVLGFVTGSVGKALAAFVCAGTALAFLAGKVSWTLVLTFTLGMACIFGAPTIIKVFTNSDTAACEP
ncbi:MAG: TrbC/VirB2 family protein [Rickettsiales bacterium]|nr:TrbC/VirB2 family protein [Rickettsiales bacterium]